MEWKLKVFKDTKRIALVTEADAEACKKPKDSPGTKDGLGRGKRGATGFERFHSTTTSMSMSGALPSAVRISDQNRGREMG